MSGPTPGTPPPNREQVLQREQKAWELRGKGWTHQRIADTLGLERSTVSKILSRLSRQANKRIIDAVVEERHAQLSILRHIVEEAMTAWERSKDPGKTITRVQPEPTTKEGEGTEGSGKAQITQRLVDQDGNSTYLRTTMDALEDIRKILGLDAPQRNFNVNLSDLTDEQLDMVIAGADLLDVLLAGKKNEQENLPSPEQLGE